MTDSDKLEQALVDIGAPNTIFARVNVLRAVRRELRDVPCPLTKTLYIRKFAEQLSAHEDEIIDFISESRSRAGRLS